MCFLIFIPDIGLESLNVSTQHEKKMVWVHFTVLGSFKCVHPEWADGLRPHFTVLKAFKCVHPASEAGILLWNFLEPSAEVIVAAVKQGVMYFKTLSKKVSVLWDSHWGSVLQNLLYSLLYKKGMNGEQYSIFKPFWINFRNYISLLIYVHNLNYKVL